MCIFWRMFSLKNAMAMKMITKLPNKSHHFDEMKRSTVSSQKPQNTIVSRPNVYIG